MRRIINVNNGQTSVEFDRLGEMRKCSDGEEHGRRRKVTDGWPGGGNLEGAIWGGWPKYPEDWYPVDSKTNRHLCLFLGR